MVPDFELWARFFKFAEVYTTYVPLGGICNHTGQDVFLAAYTSMAKKIWLKHYGKSSGRLYRRFCGILLAFNALWTSLKHHQLKIVEYNFKDEQWQIQEITIRLVADMV